MRSLITLTLSIGLLTACGDKETEDTSVAEEVEETESSEESETGEESEDTSEGA